MYLHDSKRFTWPGAKPIASQLLNKLGPGAPRLSQRAGQASNQEVIFIFMGVELTNMPPLYSFNAH
ncbi:hypothetical protein [Spirosoma endophyticum]|uniref:hypothetical protein n=1 Tax=Spirosoma endophyticum TaxID=662367 RepID=UPI000B85B3E1|nr:hypothetical protein [Spirosoma endophyticum]